MNVRWIVGKGKMVPMTTIRTAILLKHDPDDEKLVQKLSTDDRSIAGSNYATYCIENCCNTFGPARPAPCANRLMTEQVDLIVLQFAPP